MAAGSRGQDARRPEVGDVLRGQRLAALAGRAQHAGRREHVQGRCHPEPERLFQCVPEGVDVAIDQAGQKRHAAAIYNLGLFGDPGIATHRPNASFGYHHGGGFDEPFAVEHARAGNGEGRGAGFVLAIGRWSAGLLLGLRQEPKE